jgi:tetratricopeptide (TPR) repeat protein
MTRQKQKKQFKNPPRVLVSESPIPPDRNKINRFHIGFIALFAFLLYSNTLFFKYTLDDTLVITENTFTKQGFSGIKKILTTDSFVGFLGENKNLLPGGRYRPLSQISFAVEYELLGLNPFVGHLINVLLYSLLCVLLFMILKKLLISNQKAEWYLNLPFVITLLFAAHPIHTEVVANIKGRDEIMGLSFVFASILFVLKYLKSADKQQKLLSLFLSFVCFLLALLSKENAATFLLIIPVALYYFRKESLLKKTLAVFPLFLALLIFVAIRYKALGFFAGTNVVQNELLNYPYLNSSISEKYATIFYTLWKYIQLLVFPHPLTHDYYPKQIPIINWSDYRAFLPLILYIGLIFFGIWGFFKKNIYAFGIIIYLSCLSIASNIVFNVGTFMNERFVFAASLGFCLILSYFLVNYVGGSKIQKSYPSFVKTILIIIICLYSIKTFSRNFAWKDDLTLFTTDAKTSPNSAKVNISAGNALMEEAKKESSELAKTSLYMRAKVYLVEGLKIYPENIAGWVLLGSNYVYLKDYRLANDCYENCLRMSKTYPYAITNLNSLGQIAFKEKKYDMTIRSFKILQKYQGEKAETQYWLGMAYAENNNLDSAVFFLNAALKTDSTYYQAYNKLGEIFGNKMNNLKQSLVYLTKAYNINQKDVQVLQNLGVAHGISGSFAESVSYLNKAIKIDSTNFELFMNLGGSYMGLKEYVKAKECFTKAEKLKNLKNPKK